MIGGSGCQELPAAERTHPFTQAKVSLSGVEGKPHTALSITVPTLRYRPEIPTPVIQLLPDRTLTITFSVARQDRADDHFRISQRRSLSDRQYLTPGLVAVLQGDGSRLEGMIRKYLVDKAVSADRGGQRQIPVPMAEA
jgi:hypothetical protein